MMYPKTRKKKRKQHKTSILHQKDGTCYLCMKSGNYRRHQVIHEHHIFGGPNRQISEAEGMKVYLCLAHHIDGPEAVHNNIKNMRILQEDGQRAYERTHSRKEFMERFGRNYLDEDRCQECFGAAGNDCQKCEEVTGEFPPGFQLLTEGDEDETGRDAEKNGTE